MYTGCACCEGGDSTGKQKSSYLCCCCYDEEMRLCRWRRRRLADLRAVSSLEDWRSERWRGGMRRRRGRPFLGPLGCLWSRTHLSLRESAEETLESDIHPPSSTPPTTPPPSILEMLCMTATATQPAGSPLSSSQSLSLSLPLPRGEYQWHSAFGRYTYNTYTLQ